MFPTWPHFDSAQIDAATSVLRSGNVNYWTGKITRTFEEEFSTWIGVPHSVAVANGSLALSLAYLALGIGENDEVITTPRTFIATSSSIVLLGARPIFADVDQRTGLITPSTIEPLISPRTKAISVVHLAGWPADMDGICSLAKAYDLSVVEDCAQAHGALINGRSVGSFGDVSAWSFCQDKIMSTGGEGGMVSTSDPELLDRMWSFKDHGKTLDSVYRRHHPEGFRWVHDRFGSNFRLTEFQSSIGRVQLTYMSEWTSIRNRNARILLDALGDINVLSMPEPAPHLTHAWYKFYGYLLPSALLDGWDRNRIVFEINQLGFPAFAGSCSEIYLEKCFTDLGISPPSRLPVARQLGETSLMLLVHPTIDPHTMSEYASAVRHVLLQASI